MEKDAISELIYSLIERKILCIFVKNFAIENKSIHCTSICVMPWL